MAQSVTTAIHQSVSEILNGQHASTRKVFFNILLKIQAVRVAIQYAPASLLPRGRPSASRAAEQTQRSSTFHVEYDPITLTAAAALCVKAALSKAAGDLDL